MTIDISKNEYHSLLHKVYAKEVHIPKVIGYKFHSSKLISKEETLRSSVITENLIQLSRNLEHIYPVVDRMELYTEDNPLILQLKVKGEDIFNTNDSDELIHNNVTIYHTVEKADFSVEVVCIDGIKFRSFNENAMTLRRMGFGDYIPAQNTFSLQEFVRLTPPVNNKSKLILNTIEYDYFNYLLKRGAKDV